MRSNEIRRKIDSIINKTAQEWEIAMIEDKVLGFTEAFWMFIIMLSVLASGVVGVLVSSYMV